MFRRYLGLSIEQDGLQAVCLRRRSGRFEAAWAMADCSGIQPAADTPVLEDAAEFVATAQKLLHPLAGGEDRLGLSLPDECGRIVILQLPQQPGSSEEERQMLKWKLRDLLACSPDEVRIAYDRLSDHADGDRRYAVHTVRETIFGQLADCLGQAGFQIDFAGFRSLNIWRQAAANKAVAGRHLFLAENCKSLTLLAATDGCLDACRTVLKASGLERAAEVARTLTDWKRQKLIESEQTFFIFSNNREAAGRLEQLGNYIGRPLTPLATYEQIEWNRGRVANREQRHNLTAAAAAAQLLVGA